MTNPSDILLTKLSWDELEDWAGDTIVGRGTRYRDYSEPQRGLSHRAKTLGFVPHPTQAPRMAGWPK